MKPSNLKAEGHGGPMVARGEGHETQRAGVEISRARSATFVKAVRGPILAAPWSSDCRCPLACMEGRASWIVGGKVCSLHWRDSEIERENGEEVERSREI